MSHSPSRRPAHKASTVFVVDDDPSVRQAVRALLASVGHPVEAFQSAEEFLARRNAADPGCLVLDVRLPEISGLELQRRLNAAGDHIPVIFVTGHGDVPMCAQALKTGAVDFLLKPFREQELLETVQAALRQDRVQRDDASRLVRDLANYRSLTGREREILHHVVAGKINKQIAAAIGISDVTVKIHRAQVMRKMGATSLAELVRIADKIGAPA
ncbi:response regulator transcription factor [Sphingomonas quercus]|uniref:Response regulator n=1 Tax=Sphingomonas quercus TaxID=2842451 RepID=A0ABS6BJV0_9SPHN|nr:response regulator [Sphingomonas quercus]MBU3078569.1 response regulator [Sphingomonas quercus]